jgi:hypothetical protein
MLVPGSVVVPVTVSPQTTSPRKFWGLRLGLEVGDTVGEVVGLTVGLVVGDTVGDTVGEVVGLVVGTPSLQHTTSPEYRIPAL